MDSCSNRQRCGYRYVLLEDEFGLSVLGLGLAFLFDLSSRPC